MKRSSALAAKLEEDASNFIARPNYTRTNLDDNNSYFLHNHTSDSDSVSDESRKIRKKRDAYHKISDEIRVQLLESVQSGETLKSAAKRFKINYSSAKSILHTYRKEGRILKKSAQERTTKKRVITHSDSEAPQQVLRSSKKEYSKKVVAPLAERTTTATTCATYNDETSPHNGLSDNLVSILKMEHYENQHVDTQALTRPPMLHMAHQGMNYPEFHFPEAGDLQANEIDYPSNMHLVGEFDPFSDMMSALQPRMPKNEEAFHDSGAFFYPRGFNAVYNFDEKMGKAENGVSYEDNTENAGNCTLKSFMDTQKLFQEAMQKSTFWNRNGNQGFRKSSFDMF